MNPNTVKLRYNYNLDLEKNRIVGDDGQAISSVVCENKKDLSVFYFSPKDNDNQDIKTLRVDALKIMLKKLGIEQYELIPGVFMSELQYFSTPDYDTNILIIKFKNIEDEIYFRLMYGDYFFNNSKHGYIQSLEDHNAPL